MLWTGLGLLGIVNTKVMLPRYWEDHGTDEKLPAKIHKEGMKQLPADQGHAHEAAEVHTIVAPGTGMTDRNYQETVTETANHNHNSPEEHRHKATPSTSSRPTPTWTEIRSAASARESHHMAQATQVHRSCHGTEATDIALRGDHTPHGRFGPWHRGPTCVGCSIEQQPTPEHPHNKQEYEPTAEDSAHGGLVRFILEVAQQAFQSVIEDTEVMSADPTEAEDQYDAAFNVRQAIRRGAGKVEAPGPT